MKLVAKRSVTVATALLLALSSFVISLSNAYTPIFQAVRRATVILPEQGLIEDFVHHNPLENLQNLEFEDAINYLKQLESYESPGERTFRITGDDPRKREKLAIVDLSAVYLDRGAAKWSPRFRSRGFLYFFARLESRGIATWRGHARKAASKVLQEMENMNPQDDDSADLLAERIIQVNLENFGIPPQDYDKCLVSMMFKIRGWAGMFHHMESHPQDAPPNAPISLIQFCAVQTIMARSAIESVAQESGAWNYREVPLSAWLNQWPNQRKEKVQYFAVNTASRIAEEYNTREERSILEEAFEQKVLNALSASETQPIPTTKPDIQVLACIDDREGSLRRHLEQIDPEVNVETYGVMGSFDLPIRYKSFGQQVALDVTPNESTIWNVEEVDDTRSPGEIARYKERAKFIGQGGVLFDRLSFSPPGSLLLLPLGPIYLLRLFLMGFAPTLERQIMKSLRVIAPEPKTDIAMEISPSESAASLATTLRSSGIIDFFAPIVVCLGHGASSVNNPYFSGYNCGACAGKKGGPNARVFARLANDPLVRSHLSDKYDIHIPPSTLFISAEHDTTRDTVLFYDSEDIPDSHVDHFAKVKSIVTEALGRNAVERCKRFILAGSARVPEEALKHVLKRSLDFAEVRPELNHATNAGVIVGRRTLTKYGFFDRRVFLTSYDPFMDDEDGTFLEAVLGPSLTVCSGINLEYLFSTLAIDRYGAGTKAPLNIVGNIGMQQGTYGDIRTGLPSQMVEMHVPVRALFVIDAPFERVQKVLARNPELDELPRNNWVHLTTRDPETGQIYDYLNGSFVPIPMKDETSKSSLTVKTQGGSFIPPVERGLEIKRKEDLLYGLAMVAAVLSFAIPFEVFSIDTMMNPHGALISAFATGVSLPVISFSRRYLHGEFIFARTAFLCSALVLGFNLVAMAPNLEEAVEGWGLFGFASTFLIGSYNDRITVRKNAIFAFAAYRISDMALLTAIAFGGVEAAVDGYYNADLVAGSLIVATMLKSSQFPLTSLFSRSMEGPTPTSALGYAGLSAHVGLVLLSSTIDIWLPIENARMVIAAIGITTAVYSGLLSQIHADRKGALAYATASTIGLLYVIMAAGYPDEALGLAFAHAAIRMVQVLRAPSALEDSQQLVSDLGSPLRPDAVPDWLYDTCWALHRFDTDFSAVRIVDRVSAPLARSQTKKATVSQPEEAAKFAGLLLVAGLPFTPVADAIHEVVIDLLQRDPLLAVLTMLTEVLVSVVAMRFILVEVLGQNRDDKFAL